MLSEATSFQASPDEYFQFGAVGRDVEDLMLFQGRAEIGALTNLVTLDLRINKFSGPLPTSISNLVQLTQMWLESNALSGPIG